LFFHGFKILKEWQTCHTFRKSQKNLSAPILLILLALVLPVLLLALALVLPVLLLTLVLIALILLTLILWNKVIDVHGQCIVGPVWLAQGLDANAHGWAIKLLTTLLNGILKALKRIHELLKSLFNLWVAVAIAHLDPLQRNLGKVEEHVGQNILILRGLALANVDFFWPVILISLILLALVLISLALVLPVLLALVLVLLALVLPVLLALVFLALVLGIVPIHFF
jgi:hypothetical protein